MAIEAHLYPSNIGFPLCVPQDLSSFNSQQQHFTSLKHQQHPEQCLQQLHTSTVDPINPLFPSNFNAYNYNTTNKYHHNQPSKSLAIEFAQQRDEVDQYIKSQNEKLRIMLQQQRKQQVLALLKKVESDAIYMLNQKDEQIAQAVKKRAELEEFLRRLEAENQSWRRVAQENEAIVLSLHNTLEQIKEKTWATEDAESCCDENRAMEEETWENRVCSDEAEQITSQNMVCKCCYSHTSCFMFLPCRHLCSCKACEGFLQACPVCRMPKKSSIETLIF